MEGQFTFAGVFSVQVLRKTHNQEGTQVGEEEKEEEEDKGEDNGEDGDGLRDYVYCTIDHRTIYYHAFVQHSDDHGLRHQLKLRPLLCTP